MIKLGILFGGRSGEHEVSLVSATAMIHAADKTRYRIVPIGITKKGDWLLYDGPVEKIADGPWEAYALDCLQKDPARYSIAILGTGGRSLKDTADFIIPAVHGPYCEDGKLQGLLDMADIPYAGSGVTGSATAMDKIIAKAIFKDAGLPVGPYVPVMAEEFRRDYPAVKARIEAQLTYPVFVKPANMGSSVGISKVNDGSTLEAALEEAARHDRRIIVEQGIDGIEVETSVLGNYGDLQVSCVGQISYTADFYDYEAKYQNEDGLTLTIPADLPEEITAEMSRIAKEAFLALDCCGYARADFFLEKGTNKLYLNELNTLPGCTGVSMFPLLWKHSGLDVTQLVERIEELGYERYSITHRG